MAVLHTIAVMKDGTVRSQLSLDQLGQPEVSWFWVDFDRPNEDEIALLESHFHFHPLAVEDCMHFLQRPKLDHYENEHFFVLHTLNQHTLEADELDAFLGDGMLVTFHLNPLEELTEARSKWLSQPNAPQQGPIYALHTVIDKIVDYYFPSIIRIEDQLFDLEAKKGVKGIERMMEQVFDIRGDLLQLRRTVFPMRELLYRIVNSERIQGIGTFRAYFTDIYDHLLKLSDMIESNREMSSDMRDSYLSLNSNRMNTIMKTLTVITTIFMPLTFIAGVYGMNFTVMPELETRYGYFVVIGVMSSVGIAMFLWFRRKGWFD